MIGYICKYTPIALFDALGIPAERVEPLAQRYERADTLIHPNTCAYIKAVLEDCLNGRYEGMVLTACCDSARRLYDVLKSCSNMGFLHVLELPRKSDPVSLELFASEIEKLALALEKYLNSKGSRRALRPRALSESIERAISLSSAKSPGSQAGLVLAGARFPTRALASFRDRLSFQPVNLTCTGPGFYGDKPRLLASKIARCLSPDKRWCASSCGGTFDSEERLVSDSSWREAFRLYAELLLGQRPCMRMMDPDPVKCCLESAGSAGGLVRPVVFHTVKFCDQYSYAYARLVMESKAPLLKVETDYTDQGEGQMVTRLQAFLESTGALGAGFTAGVSQGPEAAAGLLETSSSRSGPASPPARGEYFAGIDSGSLSTDAVIVDGSGRIVSWAVVNTGARITESAEKVLKIALQKAGLEIWQIKGIVATGYGRGAIPFASAQVTEITCHARGTVSIRPGIRTVIDIGGQDSKVIRLDESGRVKEFSMNDKCSAGTGRFLEVMAKALEIPLEELGNEALKSRNPVIISSMCTVFAESEVVNLVAQNKDRCDIVKGICDSVAGKTVALLDRLGREGPYMMTGGVAKNIGVVRCIERRLGEQVFVPDEPQVVGALGAALFALDGFKSGE